MSGYRPGDRGKWININLYFKFKGEFKVLVFQRWIRGGYVAGRIPGEQILFSVIIIKLTLSSDAWLSLSDHPSANKTQEDYKGSGNMDQGADSGNIRTWTDRLVFSGEYKLCYWCWMNQRNSWRLVRVCFCWRLDNDWEWTGCFYAGIDEAFWLWTGAGD